MSNEQVLDDKLFALETHLASYPKLAVAFSGGVDSSFLLAAAFGILGENLCALTARSPAFPKREHAEAVAFCEERGIRHIVFDARQFDIPGFADNPPERCYICKKSLFERMISLACEEGFTALADGTNLDDAADYRPGRRALEELGVKSPLAECGLTKRDIREASAALGLPTASKPSFACLATRFPYGQRITPVALAQVDEAEAALLGLGLSTVRVRSIGAEARIEALPEEMGILFAERARVVDLLHGAGFSYVALDLQGYRSGSMNETLE